jgi:hypothetical protein
MADVLVWRDSAIARERARARHPRVAGLALQSLYDARLARRVADARLAAQRGQRPDRLAHALRWAADLTHPHD